MRITLPLWPHQKNIATDVKARLEAYNHAYLLADPRTGKTLAMLETIRRCEFQRVLVITTKAAVRGAWAADIEEHTTGIDIFALDTGSVKERAKLLKWANPKPVVFVVNWEAARTMWKDIAAASFDLVIFDESHKAKTPNKPTSLNLAAACDHIPYKVCMTGTAWDDRPTDVYGQVRLLAPILKKLPAHHWSKYFGKWSDFFERHVVYYSAGPGKKIPLSYKNKDEITRIIEPFTIRIKAEDVMDLPEVQHIPIYLDMPAEMKQVYRDVTEDFYVEHEGAELTVDNALSLGLRQQQITGGYIADDQGMGHFLVNNPKVQTTLDLLDELQDFPVVIFTKYTSDVVQLQREIKDRKIYLLTGEADQHMLWRKATGNEVLIANMSAGAEGIDLSRARYVIYYSKDFSNSKYVQSLARCRSAKSDLKHPITYHHLIMKSSVDETVQRALEGKTDVAQAMYEEISRVGA